MRSTFAVMVLLSFGLIASGGEANDKDKLQGKWKVVSARYGRDDLEKEMAEWTIQFKGDLFILTPKGSAADVMSFKIDPKKKPKEIDFYGNGATPEIPLLGIYAIEGDKLKLSWSKIDGKFRPGSFELPDGKNKTRQVSLVLERIKM